MAQIEAFGTTATGQAVRKITLRAGEITASVLTWGAVLQSVRLEGVAYDLTHGSDRLADYEGDMRYHGSLIAPVVNRLSDAGAPVAGGRCGFEVNFNGRHSLHSGSAGTHLKVWDLVSATETEAVLALDLPDGEGGFPGNRRVEARFSAAAPATLRMAVTVTTDTPTIWNAANHSYWNLDGGEGWAGHRLRIAAEHYLPTDADFIPTGEIAPVAGTAFDFRAPRTVAPSAPDLDNCFCLGHGAEPLREVLWLTGTSGLTLTVATTEAGVQVYDGRHAVRPGRAPYEGLAIETQGWPDAPNKAGFPSIDLAPDAPRSQITEWRFSRP
jgi:aldose 1-epimerase